MKIYVISGDEVARENDGVVDPSIPPIAVIALVKYPKGALFFRSSFSVMN